jgi:hypothetical protein
VAHDGGGIVLINSKMVRINLQIEIKNIKNSVSCLYVKKAQLERGQQNTGPRG